MSCRTPRSLTAAVRAALFGLGLPLLAAPLSLPALADGHSYSIAAGALDEALNTFARQAGVLLSFDPALTAGRQSPGLRGHYEVDQGFGVLLAGTGLRAVDTGAGGYRLEPVPQARDGSLELQSQTISGRYGEYARGPVRGYVATRSGSATKTDTSILETPQSISVVSRAEMDARAVTTVEEALRYTPSVAVPYGYDTRYDWVSIRGFDSKNQIFRDGMKQSSSLYGLPRPDAWALERVEVLRGPASVIFGQAEPGGLVNLVSKRPGETAHNEVRLRAGSDQLGELAGDFSGALDAQNDLRYRVALLGNDSNAQVDKTGMQRQMIAPSLTWNIGDATDLTLLGLYQKDKGRFGFSFHLSPYLRDSLNLPHDTDRDFFEGEPGFNRFERTYYSLGYELTHRLNEVWTLRQNLRYDASDLAYSNIGTFAINPFDGRTLFRSSSAWDEDMSGWVMDNQAQAVFATGAVEHTLLMGLDWRRTDSDELTFNGGAPTLDILEPVYGKPVPALTRTGDRQVVTRQTGVYLQDQIALDDHWRVLLGGRYDWSKSDVDDRIRAGSRASDEAFTGRLGVVYVFDNGLAPYASYSESFNPVSGTDGLTGKPFDPEQGRQYEIGVKFQPEGARSFVSLALFDLTKEDYVLSDNRNQSAPAVRRQVGEVNARGVELEALASLAEGLDLRMFYSYTDAFITSTPNAWEKDIRLPYTPKESAGAWLDYTQPSGVLKGLGGGLGVRYTGASRYTGVNAARALNPALEPIASVESQAYTLLDASVHYSLSGVRLALNASNLLDKEYDASCSEVGCSYGYGRTVTASASYGW